MRNSCRKNRDNWLILKFVNVEKHRNFIFIYNSYLELKTISLASIWYINHNHTAPLYDSLQIFLARARVLQIFEQRMSVQKLYINVLSPFRLSFYTSSKLFCHYFSNSYLKLTSETFVMVHRNRVLWSTKNSFLKIYFLEQKVAVE